MPNQELIEKELGSSDREFRIVLKILADQLASDKIRIRFSPFGRAILKIEKEHIQTLLKDDLSLEKFTAILDNQISQMMSAILDGKQDEYIKHRVEHFQHEYKPSDTEADEFAKKLEEQHNSVKHIITDKIKAKYQIRKTTRAQVLGKIEWDIITKQYSDPIGELKLPYFLSLKINFFQNRPGPPFSLISILLGDEGDSSKALVFELDDDEIESLIEILVKAKAKLDEVNKSRG